MASQFNLSEPLDFSNRNISENWKLFKQELRPYLIAIEKLKKPNKVKTSILLNCIGKQGRQIYNNFEFSSVNDEINYDINDKIQGILHFSKKFNSSVVQISHFLTRLGRKIQRLVNKLKC